MQPWPIRSEFDCRKGIGEVRAECLRQFPGFLAIVSAQWLSEVDRRACAEAEISASRGKSAETYLRLKSVSGLAIGLDFVFQPVFDSSQLIIGIMVHGRPPTQNTLPLGRSL